MQVFANCEWIWRQGKAVDDEYTDFLADFTAAKADAVLRVAADSNYALWINGALAAFGQYADYPNDKVYDEVTIPADLLNDGANRLALQVWYYGTDTQTYRRGEAAVIFELCQNDAVLCCSSADTLSRPARDYVSGMNQMISVQLGPNYHYDNNKADAWKLPTDAIPCDFAPSRPVPEVSRKFRVRPIEKLRLEDACKSKLIQHGIFSYENTEGRNADKMQNAYLGWRSMEALSGQHNRALRPLPLHAEEGDGIYLIFDLGRNEAGFLQLDLEVPQECDIEVGYGEHLADGRCRTAVRCFAVDFKAKAGRNQYLNPFRRLGCQYLQVFIHSKDVVIHEVTLRPTNYPVRVVPYDAGNLLRQTIYDTCLRTLLLCMHEHYEDCPWREQALYTMDSRNQMLCGYYAFKEYRFPRACLELMTNGIREDGLMNLCFPAGRDYPIPFFSLMYFIQMREYLEYANDPSLCEQYFELMQTLMALFLDRRDETGLCGNFTDPAHWNFYEWQPTMDGHLGKQAEQSHDAPLNGFLSLALESFAAICRRIGKDAEAAQYETARAEVNAALRGLYNEEVGLFETYDNKFRGQYSVLTNSLMLLCGAADGVCTDKIVAILSTNGEGDFGVPVIPNTLSMNSFRFDALLHLDEEKYAPVILEELDRVYLQMLRGGATTFWETIKGEADFHDAGSLCHAWSALPVYYYHKLLK